MIAKNIKWPEGFKENARQIAFSMVQILFVMGFSMHFFLNAEPDRFAQFGALAIVWSLVQLSISRARYQSVLQEWDKSLFRAQLNYNEERNAFRDDAMSNTFDLHASQIAQIAHAINKPNPFVESNDESIQKFCRMVQEKLDREEDFSERQKVSREKFSRFHEDYFTKTQMLRSWGDLFWKLEFGIIVWGTLQNAYGADFVAWYYGF